MNYKIALVDDQVLFRIGIKNALAFYPDLEIVFEAKDGFLLLEYLQTKSIDVILLELKKTSLSAFETLKTIRQSNNRVKVLILSTNDDTEDIVTMMESKANGYLLKNSTPEVLYAAILSIVNTGFYFNSTINNILLKNIVRLNIRNESGIKVASVFSTRELTILRLLTDGKSIQEIAHEFSLSLRSIEGIKRAMQRRVGVNNTMQLVLYAIKNRFILLH